MPIRHVSWQRRPRDEAVIIPPAPADAQSPPADPGPRGAKRLVYARPLGTIPQLLLGLVALVLGIHLAAWALDVHLAWAWAAVGAVAAAALAADWPDARAGPLDALPVRRAALTARLTVFAAVGALLALATF